MFSGKKQYVMDDAGRLFLCKIERWPSALKWKKMARYVWLDGEVSELGSNIMTIYPYVATAEMSEP